MNNRFVKHALPILTALLLLVSLLPSAAYAYWPNNYPLSGSGSGSASDPFLIQSTEDWDAFALEKLYHQDSGQAYENGTLYYKLTDNITVSTPVSWDFGQFFDGGGHTITLDISDAPRACALFSSTSYGAVIENLTVSGTIRTAEQFAAGFVAEAHSGVLTIRNCVSDVVIESSVDGDGTHGGFIARTTGGYPQITIEDSVFTGQIKGADTTNCGGFVGWLYAYTSLTIRNSLYLPSGAPSDDAASGSAVIARYDRADYTQPDLHLENVYYSRALGETDDAIPVQDTRPAAGLSGPVRTVGGTEWYAAVEISGIEASYTHTGDAIAVAPVVTFNGNALAKDTDYSVSFLLGGAPTDEVRDEGNYTAVITGLGGDFTGTSEVGFKVLTTRTASTWAQLHDALADNQTDVPIRLTADLTADDGDGPLVFNAPGHAVTLDLSGFTIDLDHQELGPPFPIVLTVAGGTLTLTDSAGGSRVTGGIYGVQVEKDGAFVLSGGAITGNGNGVSSSGTFTMHGGEISGNASTMNGGGVSNSGTFTMNGGEISGNSADQNGGGVYCGNGGRFTMAGGEVRGNTAQGSGGGVYLHSGSYLPYTPPYDFAAAEFTMTGGEVRGNTADAGGGVYCAASSDASYCAQVRLSGAPVITGNLVRGMPSNVFLQSIGSSDCFITVDGALAAAAQIGVSTGREPVIGTPVVFSGVLPNAADLARFVSDNAIYQLILTNDGKASLSSSSQSAWEDLKASMAAGGTVILTRNVLYGGSNTAATEALTVPAGKTVTLDLNGYTIDRRLYQNGPDGSAFDPVIVVQAGGSLTVRDSSAGKSGTITGGTKSGIRNAGTLVLLGGAVTQNANYDPKDSGKSGGGVYNTGEMTLQGGAVTQNAGGTGAGICNEGTLRIVSGSVNENSAGEIGSGSQGGGVYNAAGGTVEMSGGGISANVSYGKGGGVHNCGSFTMSGGSIGSNEVGSVMFYGDYAGGGVYLELGSFAVSGGSIANNAASTGDGSVLGGGVYPEGGSLELSGSVRITGNVDCVRTGNDDVRTPDNVCLSSGKTLSVTDNLSGALIGVTTADKPTAGNPIVFTAGLDGNGGVGSFVSDDTRFAVVASDGGEAQLSADQTPYQITVAPPDNGTVSVSAAQAVETALVQVTLEAQYAFRVDSITVTTDGGADVPVSLESSYAGMPESRVYSFQMPADNVTVEAQFRDVRLDTYDLIFYADAAGNEVFRTIPVAYSAALLPYAGTALERENYTFLGWTTLNHPAEYTYNETLETGILFPFDGTMADAELKLYPVLLKDRFQVRLHLRAADSEDMSGGYEWYEASAYDPNTPASMGVGGDGKLQSRQFNVEWDEKIDMTAMSTATRTGYTLSGWETAGGVRWSADLGVAPLYADRDSAGDPIKRTATGLNYDYYILTLNAVWTPKDIDVVYDRGDHGLSDVTGDAVALGEALKLPAAGPTAEDGWLFLGWQAPDKTLFSAGADYLFSDWRQTEQETLRFTAVYLEAPAPGTYMLSFDSAGGGFVAPVQAAAGTAVDAPEPPTRHAGVFAGWYDGDSPVVFPYTMPDHNVTLTALWEAIKYTVTFDANGGAFSGKSGAEATRLTLSGAYGSPVAAPTLDARSGYTFAGWTLNGEPASAPGTMPDNAPVYTAAWTRNAPVFDDPEPAVDDPVPVVPPVAPRVLPYTDVPADVWFYDAVYECFDRGYLIGVSDTAFAPDSKMTRAMFATVLYRVAGEPAVSVAADFEDVAQGAWYSDAVNWAASEGILLGYGNGRFGTNDFVSREQILTILWRFAGSLSGSEAGLSAFADAETISPWARAAYAWALRAGVLSGTDAGLPNPKGAASRAEVAQLVMNYVRTLDRV